MISPFQAYRNISHDLHRLCDPGVAFAKKIIDVGAVMDMGLRGSEDVDVKVRRSSIALSYFHSIGHERISLLRNWLRLLGLLTVEKLQIIKKLVGGL